jgi:hypothetical protein
VREFPFAIPVIFELLHVGVSTPEVWRALRARLGNAVWEFLPRRRRLPHNGKHYVNLALRRINEYALVSQHIITHDAMNAQGIQLLVLLRKDADLLNTIHERAASLHVYSGRDVHLVRVLGDHHAVKTILGSDAVLGWWLVDDQRTREAPVVRFAYEQLFSRDGWRVAA